jgi:riboflavin synthase
LYTERCWINTIEGIMFTGIIEEVGRVDTLSRRGTSAVLDVLASRVLESMQLGDSIAVNGVCLTVRRQSSGSFQVELSQETLNRSSLGNLKGGSLVNLERPLLAYQPPGGALSFKVMWMRLGKSWQ